MIQLPKISIVMIDSRSKINKDWVELAINSIKSQYYRDIDFTIVDNTSNAFTIGKCRNDGVKQTDPESKWVLFVDDDDYISKDYVLNLLSAAEELDNKIPNLQMVTTSSVFVYPDHNELREESPIGMWKREFLINNPFSEYLLVLEDKDLLERLRRMGGKDCSVTHIAGYFYRQHNNKNSGFKTSRKNDYDKDNLSQEIKKLAKEIGDELGKRM